jgi:hypothetical protein
MIIAILLAIGNETELTWIKKNLCQKTKCWNTDGTILLGIKNETELEKWNAWIKKKKRQKTKCLKQTER